MAREQRGNGRYTIQTNFYEKRSYHYTSPLSCDPSFASVIQEIWNHTLSSRIRAQLDAASLLLDDEKDENP